MQLVIYNKHDKVLSVYNANNISVDGNDIKFDKGQLRGVTANYAVFPDDTIIQKGDTITPEILSTALADDFKSESVRNEDRLTKLEGILKRKKDLYDERLATLESQVAALTDKLNKLNL